MQLRGFRSADRIAYFLATLAAAAIIAGCKLEVIVPAGGRVVSESGNFSCDAGQSCTVDITDVFFDETFRAEVLESDKPVIIDFWAEWCAPCRQIAPIIKDLAKEYGDRVKVLKMNIDESPQTPGQYRIQSIPTVYAFHQGRPVDAFQGALPPSELKKFVEKLAALAGDDGLGAALDEADAMLADGAAVDAAEVFAAVLAEEPDNTRAFAGLASVHRQA